MCCKEERKFFLKKRTESLKSQEKKKGNEQKGVAGLVPMGDGIATIGRKRVAVCQHSHNANGSASAAPLPDRSSRRIQKQKTAISDSPVAHHPHDEEEKLGQWNINDLPLDILVCVVCKVKHDELKPLSHVSKNFREAVLIARQVHFDFTTPSRPRVWNSFNALSGETDGVNGGFRPPTPDAPRNTRKSQVGRLTDEDIREVAVTLSSLFEDEEINCVWRKVPSNRILFSGDEFSEDELCEAVV